MEELLRTNDPVTLSVVEAILSAAEIPYLLLDSHMSALEGSLGIIPRRILVPHENRAQARRLVRDLGLERELGPA